VNPQSTLLLGQARGAAIAAAVLADLPVAEYTALQVKQAVVGHGKAAKEQVLQLVEALGLSGWDAGPLKNAVVAESLTSVLIGINRRYKLKGAGIRIVGERAEPKET